VITHLPTVATEPSNPQYTLLSYPNAFALWCNSSELATATVIFCCPNCGPICLPPVATAILLASRSGNHFQAFNGPSTILMIMMDAFGTRGTYGTVRQYRYRTGAAYETQ
jgi:hypothetical protein